MTVSLTIALTIAIVLIIRSHERLARSEKRVRDAERTIEVFVRRAGESDAVIKVYEATMPIIMRTHSIILDTMGTSRAIAQLIDPTRN
jgi:hypothetical protein